MTKYKTSIFDSFVTICMFNLKQANVHSIYKLLEQLINKLHNLLYTYKYHLFYRYRFSLIKHLVKRFPDIGSAYPKYAISEILHESININELII